MRLSRPSSRGFGPLSLVLLGLAGATWGSAQVAPGETPTKLETVTVAGQPVPGENKAMGSYQQPEWTARRPFVMTRVYVQPEGQAEVELGYDTARVADGFRTRLFRQEIELGLPHRWQVDLENTLQDFEEGGAGPGAWHRDSTAVELRHALADWDKIPLNPTLSVAWKSNAHAADACEAQLLLGSELSPRWHWGVNFLHEQQAGGDRFRERSVSAAISYSVVNEKLNLGVETKYGEESDKDTRGNPVRRWAAGPSLQWRPTDRTHFDVVPMWGATRDAARLEVFVFFGFEFGDGSDDGDEHRKVEPASLRGR
jgi:hypothetical protein